MTEFREQHMDGSVFERVSLRGARFREVYLNDASLRDIDEAELDRRDPDRARTFPPEELHESVDDEWSFVQTLRHLNFASACWVDRMILGVTKPWDPLDLPWDEAPPGDWFEWDRDARYDLDDVLAVRRTRRATVQDLLDSLTDERLAAVVSPTGPGHPPAEEQQPVGECLRVLLNEEWHHRLFAERDLSRIDERTN